MRPHRKLSELTRHGSDLLAVARDLNHAALAQRATLYFVLADNREKALDAAKHAEEIRGPMRGTWPAGFITGLKNNFDSISVALRGLVFHPDVEKAIELMKTSAPTDGNQAAELEVKHYARALEADMKLKRHLLGKLRQRAGIRAKPAERIRIREALRDYQHFYLSWHQNPLAELATRRALEKKMGAVRTHFALQLKDQGIPEPAAEMLADALIGMKAKSGVAGYHAYLLHALSLLEEKLPFGKERKK